MKTKYWILFLVIIFAVSCASSPKVPDDLDLRLRQVSDYLNENIPRGRKIAFINVQSDFEALSEYIIDELIANAVNDRIFSVVDRQQLDVARAELDFNLSGEVSDQSAQQVGKMLGAQIIITGRITQIGDLYRLNIRALVTETVQVQASNNWNLSAGKTLTALLKSGSGGRSSTGYGTRSASGSNNQTTSSRNISPANGTYTFYPRLRPYLGATLETGVYIHKVVVRGDFISIYFCADATGATNRMAGGTWTSIANQNRNIVLQNLDNPSQSWNPENGMSGAGYNWNDEGGWFSFRNVRGTRFSLTNNYGSVPSVFEEIKLDQPDQ